MPKVVDHDERRELIASALWRVAARDGMAGTSVRSVAAEAGLSPGALRHYFVSQAELLRFATEAMSASVARRIEARADAWTDRWPTPDEMAEIVLELVPLDPLRTAEFEVWLELVLAARTTPAVQPVALAAHRRLRTFCVDVVLLARHLDRDDRRVRRSAPVQTAAEQLHATVDGLALHLSLYPGETSSARARATVDRAVRELVADA